MDINYYSVFFKYFLIFLVVILSYLNFKLKIKNDIFELIGIFFLILISTFRYGFGRDYFSYRIIFNNLKNEDFNYFPFEPFSQMLFDFFAYLAFPFEFLLFVFSAFYILTVYIFYFKKNKKSHRYFLFLLFFIVNYSYFNSLGLIRQYIAVSFFLIGCLNVPIFIRFPLFLIAVLSHFSALLPILLFFINLSFRKWTLILIISFTMVISFLSAYIFDYVFNFINTLSAFPISSKYFVVSNRLSILHILFYSFILFQIYIFYKFKKNFISSSYTYFIANFSIYYLIFSFLTITGINSISRLLPYFSIFYILSIVNMIMFYRNKFTIYVLVFLLLFYFFSFEIKNFYGDTNFSKYNSQLKLSLFKDQNDFELDSYYYKLEEKALYENYRNNNEK